MTDRIWKRQGWAVVAHRRRMNSEKNKRSYQAAEDYYKQPGTQWAP